MPVLLGIAFGVVCALPMLHASRVSADGAHGMGMGQLLAFCLAPFMVQQAVLVVVCVARPAAVLPFGASAALSFLVVVTACVLRDWYRQG